MDRKAIIVASLLHDIAKSLTFDLEKQAQFGMTPGEIEGLRELQDRTKNDHGSGEHQAAVGICRRLGCGELVARLIDDFEWSYLPRL